MAPAYPARLDSGFDWVPQYRFSAVIVKFVAPRYYTLLHNCLDKRLRIGLRIVSIARCHIGSPYDNLALRTRR